MVAEYAGKTASDEIEITVSSAEEDTPADTGKEADLADYIYHKSIIESLADSWSSGTGITGTTTKTMVSGNLWGAGGVGGVSPPIFTSPKYKSLPTTLKPSGLLEVAITLPSNSNSSPAVEIPTLFTSPPLTIISSPIAKERGVVFLMFIPLPIINYLYLPMHSALGCGCLILSMRNSSS